MLSKLEIKGTRDTPEVYFDTETNIFEIKGVSLPEDSMRFFEPIVEWIIEYIKAPNKATKLVCELEYFNSSSAKMLYEVFFEFEKLHEKGHHVSVQWYFDPEDKLIEEKGLEYQSILTIPFNLIEKKESKL